MTKAACVKLGLLAVATSLGHALHMDTPTTTNHTDEYDFDHMVTLHQAYGDAGTIPEGWSWADVPGTKCMDGEETGYYYRSGASMDKLVIYLMPGGACFNSLCTTLATSDPKGEHPPSNSGIYSNTDDKNVLKDYNWLFIPYCTGDIFSGNREGDGGFKKRQFNGRPNIDLTVAHFFNLATQGDAPILDKALSSFLLTGESAGAFGSLISWDFIRTKYVLDAEASAAQYWTSQRNILVSDSGVVLDDEAIKPCLQENWRDRWGINDSIPAGCTDCTLPNGGGFVNILDYLKETYPKDRFGLLSSNEDNIISLFMSFGLIKNGLFSKKCGNYAALTGGKKNFKAGLERLYRKVEDWPNVGTFFFPGDEHTHTTRVEWFDNFWTLNDNDDDNQVYLYDWYRQIVESDDNAWTVEHELF